MKILISKIINDIFDYYQSDRNTMEMLGMESKEYLEHRYDAECRKIKVKHLNQSLLSNRSIDLAERIYSIRINANNNILKKGLISKNIEIARLVDL